MAGGPPGPRFDGSPRAVPITSPGQSPGLGLPPPAFPPTEGVPGAPPPGSFTPSRTPPGLLPPASAAPNLQQPSFLPPSSATPTQQPRGPPPATSAQTPIEALRVQPPKENAAPAQPTMTGSGQQEQQQLQQDGADTRATVRGEPPESAKEYVSAVKAYEQQVGPNIVRGKMYIESLPAYAVPPEQRFSTQKVAPEMAPGMVPGPGCGYNIAMGVGPGQPCGYGRGTPMSSGYEVGRPMDGGYEDAGRPMSSRNSRVASEQLSRGMSLAAQLSQERFKEFAGNDRVLKFAALAEMWPQVKRLMDMGGRLEEIINVPRNYEALIFPLGSGYAGPAMRRRGSFERAMNAPGGFDDKPVRLLPDYDGPTDRYDRSPDRYDRPPARYDGPAPNARYYGGHGFTGENSEYGIGHYEQPSRAASMQPSQKRAADLLRKIREDIDEHYADIIFPQVRREVAGYEIDQEERRVRGGSLQESGTTSLRNFREDDGVSRRAWRKSSPTRRFRDDYDVPKGSSSPERHPSRRRKESSSLSSSSSGCESGRSRTPRRRKDDPRRQPSRRRKESSSSSCSSSDGKSRRSRTPRRRKIDSSKSYKSRSKRRFKSKTKRWSSSSNSSPSRGRRRAKGKSAQKKSSSSSSSSSDCRLGKKKGKCVEFKGSVTRQISSEAQNELENNHKDCEAVVESLSSWRGGNGCPFLNMLGMRPRAREGLQRSPTRNAAETLPTYGVEERNRSRNFAGEMVAYNGGSRPVSRNFGGVLLANSGVSTPTLRNFDPEVEGFNGDVENPPSSSFGGPPQRMSFRRSVYRYESQPSAFNRH